MPNADEFSELIRTGNLDFALLKPIDTQFLISFHKVDWSSLVNLLAGAVLLGISLWHLATRAEPPWVGRLRRLTVSGSGLFSFGQIPEAGCIALNVLSWTQDAGDMMDERRGQEPGLQRRPFRRATSLDA